MTKTKNINKIKIRIDQNCLNNQWAFENMYLLYNNMTIQMKKMLNYLNWHKIFYQNMEM